MFFEKKSLAEFISLTLSRIFMKLYININQFNKYK